MTPFFQFGARQYIFLNEHSSDNRMQNHNLLTATCLARLLLLIAKYLLSSETTLTSLWYLYDWNGLRLGLSVVHFFSLLGFSEGNCRVIISALFFLRSFTNSRVGSKGRISSPRELKSQSCFHSERRKIPLLELKWNEETTVNFKVVLKIKIMKPSRINPHCWRNLSLILIRKMRLSLVLNANHGLDRRHKRGFSRL